jgi:1-acyl-sn-glycerol-3-phosphate acyltransferase
MSDLYYTIVRSIGRPAFWVASRETFLHRERLVDHPGPVIVAPNHLSPYDVPCIMASTPRHLDFVSVVEFFRNRLSAWFLTGMNAFPLDRGRVDPATTRKILDRLARGRTIAMFPEGNIRTPATSLLAGGPFKPSVTRVARLAGVPIIPCVVLATGAFARPTAWLPLKRTRYAVAYGEPITVDPGGDEKEACARAAEKLKDVYAALYAELSAASGLTINDSPRPAPRPPTARDVES